MSSWRWKCKASASSKLFAWLTNFEKYQLPIGQGPETWLLQPKRLSRGAGKWQCTCRWGPGFSFYSPISRRCPFPNAGQKTQGQQWKGSLHNTGCVLESITWGLLSPWSMAEREWDTENLQDPLLTVTHSHRRPSKATVAFSNFYLQPQGPETFTKK